MQELSPCCRSASDLARDELVWYRPLIHEMAIGYAKVLLKRLPSGSWGWWYLLSSAIKLDPWVCHKGRAGVSKHAHKICVLNASFQRMTPIG